MATNLPPKERPCFCPNCGCLSSGRSILKVEEMQWKCIFSSKHMVFLLMLPFFGTACFVHDLKQLHKVMFFFDMFVWVSIELTGFPNKNVKSRIGKRKSTSTETTFNSRAWHIENWKFLGDFITGRVQASNSGFANVAFPLVRFSPSVESHQGKKVGEIEDKHEQIQRVFN